jgi:hypothetical protein
MTFVATDLYDILFSVCELIVSRLNLNVSHKMCRAVDSTDSVGSV